MTDESHAEFSPIFIVGNERSGTTMLAGLFDRHSQVAAPPETHLFYGLSRRQLGSRRGRRDRQRGAHEELVDFLLSRDRIGDMALDKARLLARFSRYEPDLRGLFRAALEEYADLHGKPRIAEKSPHHLLHVPTILDWYPNARVVCIVRDGRDAILSLLNVPWSHHDVWLHAAVWRRLVRLGVRYERRYPGRFIQVRFEDVLLDPRKELTRLMQFAGLAFEERQLDAAVGTSVVPGWESGWKKKANEELDPSRIHAWKRTATRQQVWAMNVAMGRWLERLGYPDAGLEGCPWLLRVRYGLRALVYRAAYGPALHPALKWVADSMRRMGFRLDRYRATKEIPDE